MPHKKSARKPVKVTSPPASLPGRPNQDSAAARQAAFFPSVGITLGSYKHNPFETAALQRLPKEPGSRRFGSLRRIFRPKRMILTLIIIGLLIGGWLGFKFVYNAHKLFHGNLFSVLTTTKLKGEDNGRVNILLAGNSADDAGHNGADLTDSIMIMSIDTKNNQAYLLSVPRDLWVEIPDQGHSKINYAYVAGEADHFSQSGYPNGGMGELEYIISQDFGLDINYYALVDYSALKDAVNAVGGITVTIQSDDPRGLYDPSIDYATHGPLVKLTNGVHSLKGEQALDLARARGDSYYSYGFTASDFERTQNQRMMLIALKEKAVSAGVLSNPAKLSSLSDAIGNNVKTDFTLSEVHRLYDIVKNIKSTNIKSYSLNSANGKNLLASYAASNGQSALKPALGVDEYDDIQDYINQISSTNPVVQEGAKILLLNATSTAGLASQVKTKLSAQHFTISDVGTESKSQATTTIIDTTNGKNPNTIAALKTQLGKTVTVSTSNPYAGIYSADIIVVLGADQAPAPTSSSAANAN